MEVRPLLQVGRETLASLAFSSRLSARRVLNLVKALAAIVILVSGARVGVAGLRLFVHLQLLLELEQVRVHLGGLGRQHSAREAARHSRLVLELADS